ncbi:MAG TPA: thioredoxin domain-containing protein [Spirochaetia bacterium]|nr:thioredoxin domain-containing protein [Spirochaetia bacterium]
MAKTEHDPKSGKKGESAPPTAKAGSGEGAGRRRGILIGGTVGVIAVLVAVFLIVIAPNLKHSDPITFDYTSLPMLGNSHAPVKIVEFGDFKCPSCKYFHDNIFPLLKAQYIDPGVVRFYFANFPFIGPDSTTAAIAGESIFHQNPSAFWDYYNAIYNNQGDEKQVWATPTFLVNLARKFVPGINYQKLSDDINSNAYRSQVDSQYSAGTQVGVNSTPTLFINGHEFLDFSNWEALKAAIANSE